MTNKLKEPEKVWAKKEESMGNTIEDIKRMSLEIYNSSKNQYYCSNCLSLKTMSNEHTNCSCGCGDFRWFGVPLRYAFEPIAYVGHEMEGMYEYVPAGNQQDVFFHDDGSVESDSDDEPEHCCDCYDDDDGDLVECACCRGDCDCSYGDYQYVGEFVTRKIRFTHDHAEIRKIIHDNYPSNVNTSCGGHIHISFKDKRFYSICMMRDYWVGLLNRMKKFAETCSVEDKENLLHRIRGAHYCECSFIPEKQVDESGDRYTQVNYCHSRYGTLEVRLLPMFHDKYTHLNAVSTVLDYTTDFIRMHLAYGQPERIVNDIGTSGKIKRKSHLEVYKKASPDVKPQVIESRELEVLE